MHFTIITCCSSKNIYCSYPLIPLIYFPFRRWKFVKFTLTFSACIFTIPNTTTSVAHFSYIFLIKTKFRFACVFWLLGNIKQSPLTPKLSTAYAGVDLTLPAMTSHGAYRQSADWLQTVKTRPKRPKTQRSADKVMTGGFWDEDGIILIDYLEKGKTIQASLVYSKSCLFQVSFISSRASRVF